jgi:predicted MPP superfamily phosphohydrolase
VKYLNPTVQIGLLGFIGLVILVVVTRHSDEVFARIDHEFLVPNYEGPEIQIAVLADFHFWRPTQLNRLAPLSQALVDADPDYILLLGDYVERSANWDHAAREIVAALNALSQIAPTFAVLGNHENDRGRDEWIIAFEASDIRLLEKKLWQGSDICLRGRTDIQSGQYRANLPIPIPA